jgi:hypothetical protein
VKIIRRVKELYTSVMERDSLEISQKISLMVQENTTIYKIKYMRVIG